MLSKVVHILCPLKSWWMRGYRRTESVGMFHYLALAMEDIELLFHIIQHALLTKK